MTNPAGPAKSPSVLSVLAVLEFRSLWLAQILSQLSMNALIFVLGIRIFETTGSNTAVAILFLVYGIPAVLFGMIAGSIVDKLEKRRILALCDFGRAALTLAFAIFPDNLPLIYIFTFINAVITQFYVPSEAPLIPIIIPARLLVIANSLFSFTYFSGLAIGSIAAGPFLRIFGTRQTFLILASLFIAAGINVLKLKRHESAYPVSRLVRLSPLYFAGRIMMHMKDALKYVRQTHVLKESLILLLGTQVILALLGTLGPGFAVRVLEIEARDASLYILGPAVTGIISGALWIGYSGYRIPPEKLIRTGILSAGVLLIIISVTVRISRLPWFDSVLSRPVVLGTEILLFYLLGVANSLLDVPANSMLQSHSDENMRGKMYGMLTAGVGGLGILPVVAGGILADTIGVGKVILLLGLTVVLYGLSRLRYH